MHQKVAGLFQQFQSQKFGILDRSSPMESNWSPAGKGGGSVKTSVAGMLKQSKKPPLACFWMLSGLTLVLSKVPHNSLYNSYTKIRSN